MHKRPPAWEILTWLLLPLLGVLALGLAPRPQALDAAYRAAQRARQSGDDAAAAAALAEIGRMQPWRDTFWEQAGIAAVNAGQYARGGHYLQLAEMARPLSAAGWMAWGEIHLQAGDLPAASRAWQTALGSAPTQAEAQTIYSRLLALSINLETPADFAAAQEALQALSVLEPDNPRHPYRLGLLLAAIQPAQASPFLAQAARLDPALQSAVTLLTEYIDRGQDSPQTAFHYQQAGRALGLLGEWRLARQALELAVAANPADGVAWALLGEAAEQTGQPGWPALETALQLAPDSTEVNLLAGLYWKRAGDYAQAQAYLDAAAAREPRNPVIVAELASLADLRGDAHAALVYYQEAVQLAPETAAFWLLLAQFCIENGIQIETTGLAAARQALILAPQDARALDLLGYAYYQLKDYSQAAAYLELALQAAPDYAPAHLHFGLLALGAGQPGSAELDAARQAFERVLALAPNTPLAAQAENILQTYFP